MTEPNGTSRTCPHCGVYVGHSYWVHRALVHPELNPPPPRPDPKTTKKKKAS